MYRSFVLPPPLRSSLVKLKLIFKTHHPLFFDIFCKYFYVFILINIYRSLYCFLIHYNTFTMHNR